MQKTYDGLIGTFGVIWGRFRVAQKNRGLVHALSMILSLFTSVLLTPYYKITIGKRKFLFRLKEYYYFCHWYNTTFHNERAIEIAIAIKLLESAHNKKVLEVGNVLSHYTNLPRQVIDKYEKGDNIIHEDIVDFHPNEKYDLIISISTLEHVGFDEVPRDPNKFVKAVQNLQSLLSPQGKLFVTIPVAYNPEAVKALDDSSLFSELHFYQHVTANTWKEVSKKNALEQKYNYPFQFGNGLIICLFGDWKEV